MRPFLRGNSKGKTYGLQSCVEENKGKEEQRERKTKTKDKYLIK